MALTTEDVRISEAPSPAFSPTPRTSTRGILAWVAVIAAIVAAAALAVLVLTANSDDVPSTPQLPGAVEAARGSDRHLELLADDIAVRVAAREQAVEAARGSDRHLELRAADIAQRVGVASSD